LIISDIYGRLLKNVFIYATNNFRGIYTWFSGGIRSVDSDDSYINPYYGKICNASFAANDSAIIASNYSYDKANNGNKRDLFRRQVIYFGYSGNMNISDPFFTKAKHHLEALPAPYYQYWAISPDRLYFSAVPDQHEKIVLTAVNGYHLLDLIGKFPYFSTGSKYIYFLVGNTIRTIILDLDEINSLVYEIKIFGDPGSGSQPWILL
jgi:hypothetical protein